MYLKFKTACRHLLKRLSQLFHNSHLCLRQKTIIYNTGQKNQRLMMETIQIHLIYHMKGLVKVANEHWINPKEIRSKQTQTSKPSRCHSNPTTIHHAIIIIFKLSNSSRCCLKIRLDMDFHLGIRVIRIVMVPLHRSQGSHMVGLIKFWVINWSVV